MQRVKLCRQFFLCSTHFSEERSEAGKHQGGFGVKWDGDKDGEAAKGGDGGGGVVDVVGQLLQAPVTDMKAPPLR